MEVSAHFIFSCCFVFVQMWDSSTSLQSSNRTDSNSTASAVSHSLPTGPEFTTSTVVLKSAGPKTTQAPVHTSGVTPTCPAHFPTGPHFHAGSFLGGMMLAFVITLAASLGYRLVCSRQTVRYRAIEEHDAVI
ncbi:porimin [Salminus brasiliensis]|uniref:porimin n=1 Tax=Salminus brasiliensis TaxID=930266 RepID=UPI003B833E80